ncbi:serine/arginine repetitive matrix protein 2 [Paralichthys olivaceus]|uniref:serine/arginine repetitive matrix protein 2 n=1 Tax=Paralichthys olivaceus TaxID=8255 RepID=UPI00375308CA
MTRLDPPPHRPNPRAWMDEARSREGFTRRAGMNDDREKRESGYFSLGRAAGARSLHDSSPSAPFRHFERGHPLFSARNIEPKDTIPFRNPNLGVASERQVPEDQDDDLPVEILPPDPYDIAIEVEAQVGPRSPSPTPFKVAESLASERKGFSSSYGRGNPPSHVSSYHQSGRFDSSKRSSALQSRSSSPPRGNLPFRRSESTGSLSRRSFDGGGWSQGTEPGSRSSLQSTHARRGESGTLPRSFKALPGSGKYQTSTVSDFRSALRRTEVNGSLSSRGHDGRSSSPSRRDYKPPGPMSLRKAETTSRSPAGRGRDSRTTSPSRRTSEVHRDSSSPPRRTYASSSRSLLFKSESVTSLNGRSHNGRCGSPIREGYDIESQALLRNSTERNRLDEQEHEHESAAVSPARRGYDTPTQSILRKTESSPVSGSRGRDSRCSSPGRRGYETPHQFQLRKTDTSGSLSSRGRESCNSSPSRRSYEAAPSQSLLRKPQGNGSVRGRDAQSLSPSRKRYDVSEQHSLRKTQTSSSLHGTKHASRSSSPSGKGNSDAPGYSVLRNATNGDSSRSLQRKNTYSDSKSDPRHSPRSWQESTHSLRSSSLSRGASPSRATTNGSRAAFVTLEEAPRSPSSVRSVAGRRVHEERSLSPNDRRTSHRGRSPPPSPQIQTRRHTSSQSSMESSESGPLSVGSTGRNREEYAMLADLPKVKRIHEREEPGHIGRPQNQQPSRRQELFKPASHSLSKHPSRERDDAVDTEREWHYGGSGYLSRAHSSTSLQRSGSPTADEGSSWKGNHLHRSEHMQVCGAA